MFHLSDTHSRCITDKEYKTPRFGCELYCSDILQHLSDLLSRSSCLLVGMPLETVVFHLHLVSVGVMPSVVDPMTFHKIQ
jgi:hypothetical protein